MRLYEFSKNDAVQDLVILFRNQVKRADSENAFVNLNWNAISNLMRDMGHGPFDYNTFKTAYDTTPELKTIVQNYNGDGVTLRTKTDGPKGDGVDTDVAPTKTIDKMAKRAAGKRL